MLNPNRLRNAGIIMKKLAILGSTGSIGTQTLEIVRERKEEFQITALAAGHNIDLLEQHVAEFCPKIVSLEREKDAKELKRRLFLNTNNSTEVVFGGMLGIQPTIAAINAGKEIALANKETLVTAGHIIMPLVEEHKGKLLPVDSEHSAVFQCLQGAVTKH